MVSVGNRWSNVPDLLNVFSGAGIPQVALLQPLESASGESPAQR